MPDPQTDDAPISTSKDSHAAEQAAAEGLIEPRGDSLVGRSVTINRPRSELFAFFRDFANLPTFMDNVERIDVHDHKRSHWVVKAPAGRSVEWDAIVVDEAENEYIAWASEPGADVENSGRVEFRDAAARHRRHGDAGLRSARRDGRQADRQAVPARARHSGSARPATLQAIDGDR